METVLIILLLLYNTLLVIYILMEKNIKPQDDKKQNNNRRREKLENTNSIIGKSKFQMQAKVPNTTISAQNTASASEDEDIPEMAVTFAEETPKNPSARVAQENLDATFEDVRISEVPVEYDGEDLDLMPKNEYASGKSFEQIAGAIKTADNPKASSQEEKQAGEVFSEMEGNDLYYKLLENNSERAKRIRELMTGIPIKLKDNEVKGKQAKRKNKAEVKFSSSEDEFNIRDFV